MNLREILKGKVIAENVSCFVHAHRTREEVIIQLGVSESRKSIHVIDLTREAALKLYEELGKSFEVQPLTDAEVRNHQDHQAFLKEKEGYHV